MAKQAGHASWALTILCVVLGLGIGVQLNTVREGAASTETQRLAELTETLNGLRAENEQLRERQAELTRQLADYENAAGNTVLIESLRKEAEQAKNIAGLTEVMGDGLEITMMDSANPGSGDSNAYVIHAEDILAVLNELWAAGAEAISINGERVVSNTAVTCAGSIIRVNDVRVAAPFQIQAIGDAAVMQSALQFTGGVVDNLAPWGIRFSFKKQTGMVLPAYTKEIKWEVASPVTSGEGE